MATTTVWAFQPLPELNNQTGFVSCDSDLAKRLIDENLVDDMRKGGALLRQITKVSSYSTKVMSAESKEDAVAAKKPRVRKDAAE
jgi:hypothetical protein